MRNLTGNNRDRRKRLEQARLNLTWARLGLGDPEGARTVYEAAQAEGLRSKAKSWRQVEACLEREGRGPGH